MLALLPHTSRLPGARDALGGEHTVCLLWPLPCQLEAVGSHGKGGGSCGCVLSEGRGCPGVPEGLGKHSKHLHSLRPAILPPAHPLTEGASHAH